MKNEEPLPLWLQSIPDREPWRRGRFAIVLIFVIILIAQTTAVLLSLYHGNVGQFILRAIMGCLACFLLFLMWIGQNWARWLVAPFFGAYGFANFVWGIVHGRGELLTIGLGSLVIFCYLALSPAVYAFARYQRERAGVLESVVIGLGFLLVLGTLGSALLAFHIYKSGVEQDGVEFAQLTFRRVFLNQDAQFLADHATDAPKRSTPAQFISLVDDQLGQLHDVGPFGATFTPKLEGRRLELKGTVRTRARFAAGDVWVAIQISGTERDWAIEHISWDY